MLIILILILIFLVFYILKRLLGLNFALFGMALIMQIGFFTIDETSLIFSYRFFDFFTNNPNFIRIIVLMILFFVISKLSYLTGILTHVETTIYLKSSAVRRNSLISMTLLFFSNIMELQTFDHIKKAINQKAISSFLLPSLTFISFHLIYLYIIMSNIFLEFQTRNYMYLLIFNGAGLYWLIKRVIDILFKNNIPYKHDNKVLRMIEPISTLSPHYVFPFDLKRQLAIVVTYTFVYLIPVLLQVLSVLDYVLLIIFTYAIHLFILSQVMAFKYKLVDENVVYKAVGASLKVGLYKFITLFLIYLNLTIYFEIIREYTDFGIEGIGFYAISLVLITVVLTILSGYYIVAIAFTLPFVFLISEQILMSQVAINNLSLLVINVSMVVQTMILIKKSLLNPKVLLDMSIMATIVIFNSMYVIYNSHLTLLPHIIIGEIIFYIIYVAITRRWKKDETT